jgi:hypothetical protein
MLNMNLRTKWGVIAIATLMIGLEPLAAGAAPPGTLAELTGPQPLLMARADRPTPKKLKKSKSQKSKSASTASAAEVEQFLNVHRAGMGAVRGCVSSRLPRACQQLVSSKTSLEMGCLQGKTEACSLLQTLSSQEAYQRMSDALAESVR